MDEDDDFGDLYAGLGSSSAAEPPTTSAPSIPPPGMGANAARFLDEEEDDEDDELYSGFANRRRDPPPMALAAPDSIAGAQEFAEDLPENAPPGVAGDGSESDSDDDLQIVLNNDNKRKAAEVGLPTEQETIPGEGNEEDEAPGTATPGWPEDHHHQQQQQQQQQQGGGLAETQPLLPPPSPLMGLPPRILPPGLLPQDQASRPGLPVIAAPPRPAGRPPFMHHAPFKYVRGPMVVGAPMMNSNPGVLGRGSFPPGWGPGKGPPPPGGGRPWGAPHAEFHLPPSKSVFDMDLDALEEKPWRHPNADITDYFNFGFNEITWKMYCQQLSQLRLESTMQTKISVYESRSDQPIGRAIQVEGGIGERRPSFDARRNRNRDSNEVIEIVLREAEVENHFMGNDYDGTIYDLDEPSRGRNSSFSDADGPFFPMGARPRGPPYRMFPGGPYPRGARPPFYDPGLPMHMRPEGEYGDLSRSRPRNSSQGRGAEDELSSGSVAVKDDRKHEERRSRGSRDREDDERSDEHKRSFSEEDRHDRKHSKRHSDSHPKEAADADRSSRSGDEEDHKTKHHQHHHHHHRSSRSGAAEDEPERHSRSTEKERMKEEEFSRKSSREDPRRKEDDPRRSRGDEESSRRRDREKADESWKRDRDRDRDEPQKRRSGYEDDRREREDERDRSGSRRYDKISLEDDDHYQRKSKKDSLPSSYRYEGEYYEHHHRKSGGSSSSRREHPEKDEKRSRGKDSSSEKMRNGELPVDERKRRKNEEASQKSGGVHAEKVDDELFEKKSSRRAGVKGEAAYSSDDGDDEEENKRRKGRSKMERLNRERPPQTKEDVEESLARLSSRQEVVEKKSRGATPDPKSGKVNGDRQEFLESVARRKERFMKMESSFERKPSTDKMEKVSSSQPGADTSEFKHERPARKRRWGS